MSNPSRCSVPDSIRALAARDLHVEAGLHSLRWLLSQADGEEKEVMSALAEDIAWSRLMCWSLVFADDETRALLMAISEHEEE